MQFARKGRGPRAEIVEASTRLLRGTLYFCPTCKSRVWLHAGEIKDPYFAHAAHEGQPDCEEYYPGSWGGGDQSRERTRRREIENLREEAGLCLDPYEYGWAIYLRLPEIPSEELGATSMSELRQAQVEITSANTKIQTLSALELSPARGSARIRVAPTTDPYRLRPTGRWPKGIRTERWNLSADGIKPIGTLFRFSRGEWVRLRQYSPVEWGEQLFYLARPQVVLPTICNAIRQNGGPPEWSLWHITIPIEPAPVVERWLEPMGHDITEREPDLTILTIPDAIDPESGAPTFYRGTPIIAKVERYSTADKGLLSLSYGSNKTSVSAFSNSKSLEGFFEIKVGTPGRFFLSINDESVSEQEFLVKESQGTSAFQRSLTGIPRLRMSIGENALEAWAHEPDVINLAPKRVGDPVHIDVGDESVRIDLLIELDGVRKIRSQISSCEAERVIQEIISRRQPARIRVDANSLGTLDFKITFPLQESTKGLPRVAAWLGSSSLQSSVRTSVGSAVTKYLKDEPRLLIASMRSSSPAMTIQLRAVAKRIALSRSRRKHQ